MDAEQPVAERASPGRRLMLRGESAVFLFGTALAGILLSVVAATAVWNASAMRESLERGRANEVRAVGALLGTTAEMMLAAGELSALRRVVMDAGRDYELSHCRVVLGDSQVAADLDAPHINLKALPDRWSSAGPAAASDTVEEGQIRLTYPLKVVGRGGGRLEVAAEVSYPIWTCWEAQTGIGVIGAVGLLALLLVYRKMRRRMRAMGAIREALLAAEGGEQTQAALAVSAELGTEAKAWNAVLTEQERLRKRMVADRARELLGAGQESNTELGAACDAMSQGLLLVDSQMQVKYANGAAAVFLRAEREAMVGSDICTLILEEEVLAAVRSVACGAIRRKASVEIQRQGETGTVVLRVSVRPVRREDFAAAMILIEDVTQQRVAEEARNAFVAQATHELRTPLTNIRLYAETAIDSGEDDPAARANCLNVINQEARRLEHMVGTILSVAEIEAGSMKIQHDDVRLDALFAELEADYRAQAAEKQLVLSFHLPPKLPVIQGDRDKIAMAIHNLLGNALKYTPEGGEVTVAVSSDDGALSVAVRDTGIGIGEDDRGRVFEKFYRAKDRRVAKITGSGLGLALAREVIRMHGGDITLQSELDQGSTFTLTLPAATEAA